MKHLMMKAAVWIAAMSTSLVVHAGAVGGYLATTRGDSAFVEIGVERVERDLELASGTLSVDVEDNRFSKNFRPDNGEESLELEKLFLRVSGGITEHSVGFAELALNQPAGGQFRDGSEFGSARLGIHVQSPPLKSLSVVGFTSAQYSFGLDAGLEGRAIPTSSVAEFAPRGFPNVEGVYTEETTDWVELTGGVLLQSDLVLKEGDNGLVLGVYGGVVASYSKIESEFKIEGTYAGRASGERIETGFTANAEAEYEAKDLVGGVVGIVLRSPESWGLHVDARGGHESGIAISGSVEF